MTVEIYRRIFVTVVIALKNAMKVIVPFWGWNICINLRLCSILHEDLVIVTFSDKTRKRYDCVTEYNTRDIEVNSYIFRDDEIKGLTTPYAEHCINIGQSVIVFVPLYIISSARK